MSEEGAAAITQLSGFVAEDVREYLNDKLVAEGKESWVRHWTETRVSGYVLAYSPDWRDNGSLMIVDQYDTVERWTLPPNSIADPRMISRATLFQFGRDNKIHVIRTILGGGSWIKP
jgi:hypothetical protein